MKKPLPICLLLLRIAIFMVMVVWAIDKFMRPVTEAATYQHLYHLPALPSMVMYAIGAFQILLAACFVIGLQRAFTTGLVLIGMIIYTVATYQPLFFEPWPMLAVCITLYLLRKDDNLLAVS